MPAAPLGVGEANSGADALGKSPGAPLGAGEANSGADAPGKSPGAPPGAGEEKQSGATHKTGSVIQTLPVFYGRNFASI